MSGLLNILKTRRFQRKSQLLIELIIVLGIIVFLNILVNSHPSRFDMTQQKLYSLSDQTLKVLSQLKDPVTITAFIQKGDSAGEQIDALLKEYQNKSDKIRVRVIDPEKQPSLARQYQIQSLDTVVIESGNQKQTIDPANMFSIGADMSLSLFQGEQAVTRALLGLVKQKTEVIYYLTGHGEGVPGGTNYQQVDAFLKGEGYQLKGLDLATTGSVPQDSSLLLISSPKKDLPAQEYELLKKYIQGGGKVLLLADPIIVKGQLSGWQKFAQDLGVKLHNDIVIDPERAFYADPLSPIPIPANHEINQKLLDSNLSLVMPQSVSLEDFSQGKDYLVAPLLATSDKAWGETNFNSQVQPDKDDIKGPLNLAAAVTKNDPSGNSDQSKRVAVIVGNSAFIRDEIVVLQGNVDFLVNAINWLLGNDELISIRPKALNENYLSLTGSQARSVLYGTTIGMPLIVLIIGLSVWLRRRYQ